MQFDEIENVCLKIVGRLLIWNVAFIIFTKYMYIKTNNYVQARLQESK